MIRAQASPSGDGWNCAVDVEEAGGASRHQVHVARDDLERWGRTTESPEDLVKRAFDFLLARETAGQILKTFDLADIQRYFPEFDREIRR